MVLCIPSSIDFEFFRHADVVFQQDCVSIITKLTNGQEGDIGHARQDIGC